MGLLSATVVAGLKTTGVILVVAMVITPASAAYQLSNRLWSMLILAGVFGALSAAAGMSVAFITNSPTGPAMVLVATILFGLAMMLSPSHGLLFRTLRRRQVRRHIDGEDCLKAIYRVMESGAGCTRAEAVRQAGMSAARVDASLRELKGERLVEGGSEALALTVDGRRRALELVRAHRLWESYLAGEAGIDMETIHQEAERLEHAHELADEVDEKLGHPRRDPHGEVIPVLNANGAKL
jgi:Mn-dependent DtxR family transcriptional regulator